MNHHATAISWNNIGLIFVGPSGCGKSTLALAFIEQGATLIADDQIILEQQNNHWYAHCPKTIQNKIHLNGVGLLHITSLPHMKIDLIFQSDLPAEILSQPPKINLPIIKMDFMSAGAKQFVVNSLTSFDTLARIP